MQSVWFDFCGDDSSFGGLSPSASYNEHRQPFLGIFSDDPINIAEALPRPTTPFATDDETQNLEYYPKIENQPHFTNPCFAESPPIPSSFVFEGSHGHNLISFF